MKRGIATLLAAVFALSLISATDASAVSMAQVSNTYAGQYQASGTAINYLSPGKLTVNMSYIDRRDNGYSTYAKATFHKWTRICVHNHPCAWRWNQVGERYAPGINFKDGARSEGLSFAATDPPQNYAASYSVCIKGNGKESCVASPLVAFRDRL